VRRAAWALALALAAPAWTQEADFLGRLRANIERRLGRPYVWGASGLKSFDCSGFVWRVFFDSGVLLKRTTARKLWFSLPTPERGKEHEFGNLIFFDDLQHVGVVRDRDTFFHAAKSTGTALCGLQPYWYKLAGETRQGPRPDGR
jgi:cell wall-associated NlpC family hydrolase